MAERDSLHRSRQFSHRSQPSGSTHRSRVPPVTDLSQPTPFPDGQLGRRSYYTTNPDPPMPDTEDEGEFRNVQEANRPESNYDSQPVAHATEQVVPRRKGGKANFIGGFVKSLKRIPRAMFRTAPPVTDNATIDTPMQPIARPGLPSYMLTPPTPVVPQQQTSYIEEHHIPFPQPEIEPPDILPPTTSPHPTRIEVDEQEQNANRDAESRPLSRHTSQYNHNNPSSTNHNSYAYPSSYRDRDRPENLTSIEAHPQPSPDYRRMSRNTAEESTHPNLSSYSGTPSFSSELDRNPFRMFKVVQTLINMPWISHDRVTVDYSPGMNAVLQADAALEGGGRGPGRSSLKERLENTRWSVVEQGWKPWKRTSVFLSVDGARVVAPHDGPNAMARGDARKGKMYVPVNKPLTSWYSGGYLGKRSRNMRRFTTSSRDLDLVSSGSEQLGPRSSLGTTTPRARARRRVSRSTLNTSSPTSPSPNSTRRVSRNGTEVHRHTPRRQSRRLYYSTDEYVFLDPGSTPASSPILARRSRATNPRPKPTHPRRDRHTQTRRHQRSRETSQLGTNAMRNPLPSTSPYPLSPLMFIAPNPVDTGASPVDSQPQSGPHTVFGVAPVPMYMPIMPGMPPPPGSAGGVGESSPPGFAGRGAGGGYSPAYGYNVQGYPGAGGAYAYGYSYPYSSSPPPQAHRHGEDKHRSPQSSG
ncbi:hypothetical protein D9757_002191 [Collybiopsis confluens]|uniref:Uncharacterized protein n=1 Tax=Collybiopsis confluens TaxID=2823264 RepID=A0A8H5HZL3_9AGAR|nr:hypothetical protein D9757_002191 [Collybiopsis confluens]